MNRAPRANAIAPDATSEIRALLGKIRAKGPKRGDRERAYTYRVRLQQALLRARVSAVKSSPDAFFASLNEMTKLETPIFSRQPVGADYLQQLIKSQSLPIHQEILWVSARIKYEHATIEDFLAAATEIQLAVVQDDYIEALRLLEICEGRLGTSLWSTELRVSLTQSSEGLDAQKSVLKQVRATRRVGIWPFVANQASVRAEPTVSIDWYLEETRRRQRRTKKNQFSEYVSYRSVGDWPTSDIARARVLRSEQNHHIIDIYETFISYLQLATAEQTDGRIKNAILSALANIGLLRDFRIRKLEFALLGRYSSQIPTTGLELPDTLICSSPRAQMIAAQKRMLHATFNIEATLTLALSIDRATIRPRSSTSVRSIATRGVADALHRRGQDESEGRFGEACKKFFHMYRPLPFCKALRAIYSAATEPRTTDAAKYLKLAALNSDTWGLLDLLGFSQSPHFEVLRSALRDGPTVVFAKMLAGGGEASAAQEVRQDVAALAISTSLALRARPDASALTVEPALSSNNRIVAAQASAVALNAYARTGDVALSSTLICREHVFFGVDPEALSVRDVYEGLEWSEIAPASGIPELSIALSLIQSSEGDDRLRTYRRFALESLLAGLGISKPSELRKIATPWPSPVLIYLLDRVCTPAMLDMLPDIRSTREVLEERREICGYLATIDKEHGERHRGEILAISRELTVMDGLRTIDGSRVHVDRESLARRLRTELAESFQRYVSLIRGQDSPSDGFATILRDINSLERAPDYLYQMPVSEPDELLVSMILRCREQFLFNVPHGLDSYLSKRIRHGSIIGVVRAPAERDGIVAKRNLDGSYRPGGTWADIVRDPHQRAALAVSINVTSKQIDQHLLRLKDTLLHVRSEEKPHGLLDAPLTAPGYLLIRSVAQSDMSLDSFIDTMFSALWGMLGASLIHVQSLLSKESVSFVSDQVQTLRSRAQRILTSTDERAAFDAAAGNASVGMQAALGAAASWFEPIDSNPRFYSLEELAEISLESVRATTTGFLPRLTISGHATYSFSELALPLICDVLYIAFGNIAVHNPGVSDPEILLRVDKYSEQPLMKFTIENSLGDLSSDDLEALEDKLEKIRHEVISIDGAVRARSEGGSGLHKLAVMVAQSDRGSLEFGVSGGRFKLHLCLAYSPKDLE